MRASLIGKALLSLGLLVGVIAGVGIVVGFRPSMLPAALLDIAAYKLAFIAAGGLLAGGAILRRYGLREDARVSAEARREELPAGPAIPFTSDSRAREPMGSERRPPG